LSIMSNLVYHTIRENLSNQHFQLSDDSPWPTVSVEKRLLKGSIQIKSDNYSVNSTWQQAKTMSELDVDIFDALCSFFISNANHQKVFIKIKIQDVLVNRRKKTKKNGN